MALKKCSISRLALNAVRLGLLTAWLVLTGMKISYFSSEPTVLHSRVDDEFELPYITVLRTENGLPSIIYWLSGYFSHNRSDSFERMALPNQTLLEFARSHSMSLAELSGETGLLSVEQRKLRLNQTTTENNQGKWSVTVDVLLNTGATLKLEDSPVILRLPRYTDFIAPKELVEDLIYSTKGYYRLYFHDKPCFFAADTSFQDHVTIENTPFNPFIELTY